MENKQEIVTLFDVMLEATKGNTKNLEEVVLALQNERNNLIANVNQKISEMNGQIGLLTSILNQAKGKNNDNSNLNS